LWENDKHSSGARNVVSLRDDETIPMIFVLKQKGVKENKLYAKSEFVVLVIPNGIKYNSNSKTFNGLMWMILLCK
jgi:hypothetical protein